MPATKKQSERESHLNEAPPEVPSSSDSEDRSEAELPTYETKIISKTLDPEIRAETVLEEALGGGNPDREEVMQEETEDEKALNPTLSPARLNTDLPE